MHKGGETPEHKAALLIQVLHAVFHEALRPIREELSQLREETRFYGEKIMSIEADIAAALVDLTNTVSELNATVVTLEGDYADEVKKLDAALAQIASQAPTVDLTSLQASLDGLKTMKDRLAALSATARATIDAAAAVPAPAA